VKGHVAGAFGRPPGDGGDVMMYRNPKQLGIAQIGNVASKSLSPSTK
jgi:hypothetical protein